MDSKSLPPVVKLPYWMGRHRFSKYRNSKKHSDVTFYIGHERKQYFCSGILLASISDVFDSMIYGIGEGRVQLIEAQNKEISLPEMDVIDFELLLDIVYKSQITFGDYEKEYKISAWQIVYNISVISFQYDLIDTFSWIKKLFLEYTNESSLCLLIELVANYPCGEDLEEKCRDTLYQYKIQTLSDEEIFKDMSPQALLWILKHVKKGFLFYPSRLLLSRLSRWCKNHIANFLIHHEPSKCYTLEEMTQGDKTIENFRLICQTHESIETIDFSDVCSVMEEKALHCDGCRGFINLCKEIILVITEQNVALNLISLLSNCFCKEEECGKRKLDEIDFGSPITLIKYEYNGNPVVDEIYGSPSNPISVTREEIKWLGYSLEPTFDRSENILFYEESDTRVGILNTLPIYRGDATLEFFLQEPTNIVPDDERFSIGIVQYDGKKMERDLHSRVTDGRAYAVVTSLGRLMSKKILKSSANEKSEMPIYHEFVRKSTIYKFLVNDTPSNPEVPDYLPLKFNSKFSIRIAVDHVKQEMTLYFTRLFPNGNIHTMKFPEPFRIIPFYFYFKTVEGGFCPFITKFEYSETF